MMDDRIRKRILVFYFAGFLNLVLGFYVLLNGRALVDQGTFYLLMAFFFGFAVVDFWFAHNLKKKSAEAQARLDTQGAAAPPRDEGKIKT